MTVEKGSTDDPPPGLAVPRSVAIIMDGNGRWARQRGFDRIRGHERGAEAVRETVEQCAQLGVEALTLYAFSEENWRRSAVEIKLLMKLLQRFLVQERPTMMDNNVRLLHAGRTDKLPEKVLATMQESLDLTASNTGLRLCLALSYGGRSELVDAMKQIVRKAREGSLDVEQVDEALIHAHLYQPDLPDPDLLIRTAGELRVSNFLLWQISYSEIHVADVCWPDFRKQHLWAAFEDFGRRVRKFGAVVN
ncbi:MAG: polyprenyl diphosphate synthase [Planctomycetota bacterium]